MNVSQDSSDIRPFFADGIVPKAIFATDPDTGVAPSQRKRRKLESMEEAEIHIALSNETVHWGYFSKTEEPVVTISSGSEITVEMATHHGCDDWCVQIYEGKIPFERPCIPASNSFQLSHHFCTS